MCPDFVLSRTPQFPRQKHTSEHLFLQNIFQRLLSNVSYFFKKRKTEKKITPPEAVVRKCSINKGVLKNFTKFTGKLPCQSLSFNKSAGLRLWHNCFPVNFVKISRAPILKKTSKGCFYSSSVLDTLEPLCNCIKIKILFYPYISVIILKKTTSIYLSNFVV